MCVMCEKGEISFYLGLVFNRLPVMHITFWFNAYSVIKLFSFSPAFMEKFPVLGYRYIFKN